MYFIDLRKSLEQITEESPAADQESGSSIMNRSHLYLRGPTDSIH